MTDVCLDATTRMLAALLMAPGNEGGIAMKKEHWEAGEPRGIGLSWTHENGLISVRAFSVPPSMRAEDIARDWAREKMAGETIH